MGWIGNTAARLRAYRLTTDVTIAVAGLSSSGTTVLITSAIANLLAAGGGGKTVECLRGLSVVDSGRLKSSVIADPYTARRGKRFPYIEMLDKLTARIPAWPTRTSDAYEIAIDLKFRPKQTSPEIGPEGTARLRIIFVDYPGEWLVDVPLIEQSFSDWSAGVITRLDREPWASISGEFRAMPSTRTWLEPDNDQIAKQAASEWQNVQIHARELGLKWLQPGQFLRSSGQNEDFEAACA